MTIEFEAFRQIANSIRVRAAATGNVTIATALNPGDTLDGVTLAEGMLVLLPAQTAPAENGIYVVSAVPFRYIDFSGLKRSPGTAYDTHPGLLVAVEQGTANADTLWVCTSDRGGTLDTTSLVFSRLLIAAEDIADTVGAMVTGNTETNITVTYQDSDNTLDFTVPDMSDSTAGVVEAAVQSEMEAASDITRAVTPGRQLYHPSAAKAWGYITYSGGVPTLQIGYNIAGISDTATGRVTVSVATNFSADDNYAVVATIFVTTGNARMATVATHVAGGFEIDCYSDAGVIADGHTNFMAMGDL